MIKLIKGDCLEKMKDIESGSVDMILTDVPYGTIKGSVENFRPDLKCSKESKSKSWDTALDTNTMFKECDRVLRKNGACALFGQDPLTGELMTNAIPNLPFSYRLTWLKDNFANALLCNKAPVNYTEDICLFFKKYDSDYSHPLRKYSQLICDFTNYNYSKFKKETGSQSFYHFMYNTVDNIQFSLCTENTYNKLIDLFKIDKMPGFIPYSELKKIDNKYKRTFNLPEGKKYKSNVLEYKKDYQGLHPTQKPVALLEDLIKTYTRPGDTVLDFTMGSGSTAIACLNTGRKFIGIELDDNYFEIAKKRIEDHKNNLTSKWD